MKYFVGILVICLVALTFYCKSLKSDLEIYKANEEILKNSIQTQSQTIDKLKSDYDKITESKKSLEELYKNQIKRKDIQNQIQTFEKSLIGNKKIQYSIYDCYKNEKECTILK